VLEVTGLSNVHQVSLGDDQGCALRANGEVACWRGPTPTPVAIEGLEEVVHVAAGSLSCALRRRGDVMCWSDALEGGPREIDLLPRSEP
jgi:hypothetical protein